MAFESDVSEDRLKQWVENEMGDPAGICVMNSNGGILSIFRQAVALAPDSQIDTQRVTDPDDYDPLLTFVGAVYRWLHLLFLHNSTMSDEERARFLDTRAMWFWEGYLSTHIYESLQGLAHKGDPGVTGQDA